jgi:hypothetical protein
MLSKDSARKFIPFLTGKITSIVAINLSNAYYRALLFGGFNSEVQS